MVSALHILADIAIILTGVGVIIVAFGVWNEYKVGRNHSLFYFHKYISREEFSFARRHVREKLAAKAYPEWSDEDKAEANRVCTCYDQAGIFIQDRIIDRRSAETLLRSSWGESICHQCEALVRYLDDRRVGVSDERGVEFFRHFVYLYDEARKYHRRPKAERRAPKVVKIVSGGQTGADRAALDVAREHGIAYGGWCPKGGLAEDFQKPPGLKTDYPALIETPSANLEQRTEWNVRDSSLTLILLTTDSIEGSEGTQLTKRIAEILRRPCKVINVKRMGASQEAKEWMKKYLGDGVLNVAGPRESQSNGIYESAKRFLESVLEVTG